MRIVTMLAALILIPACANTQSSLERRGQTDTDMGTQGSTTQQPGTGQQPGMGQQGSIGQTQQLQAKVVEIDRGRGEMTVSSNGTSYTLRGTPMQLQRYSQGQDVSLQYQTFGENAWLVFEGTGIGGTGSAGTTQNFSGTVSQINQNDGTVVIGSRTFHAHPTQLQGLTEGQQATVAFQTFDDNVWLQQVQGMGGAGTTGQMGTQSNCGPGGTGGSGQTDTTQGGTMQGGTMQGGTMQGGTMQGGTMQGGTMQQGTQQPMAPAQQLQGKVVSINPNVGEMSVSANGKTIPLRGTPEQLQRYSKGQTVSLQYRNYGKTSWLVREGMGGSGMESGNAQRFTGTVSKIDQNKGSLTIGSRTFFAHPDQLMQITQGQQVTVTFMPHGNTMWVQNLQVGSGAGTGGTGEEGTEQPGGTEQPQDTY